MNQHYCNVPKLGNPCGNLQPREVSTEHIREFYLFRGWRIVFSMETTARVIHRIKNYGSGVMKAPSTSGLSSKEPDQSFGYGRPRFRPRLHVAIECGVSENYKALCRYKDLWIQELGAKVVILICIKEVPRYKSPRTYEYTEGAIAEIENMDQYVIPSFLRPQ
ncbi:hypothetical protein V1506DRAFT_64448 [Lipomyces tetrasporus]